MSPVTFAVRGPVALPGASYAGGPGDIAPGAIFWVGLRAYSIAAIGGNVLDLVRNDAATMTVASVAGGGLDPAVVAWMSGHTAVISKLYDQTGHGHHFISTGTQRPTFTVSGLGSFAVATVSYLVGAGWTCVGGITGPSRPYSFSWAAKNTFASSVQNNMIVDSAGTNAGYNALGANSMSMYNLAGGGATQTGVSDNAYHSIHILFGNPSSASIMQFDLSSNAKDDTGATAWASSTDIGLCYTSSAGSGVSDFFDGSFLELGMWGSDIHTSFNGIAGQQKTYWGWP